MIRLLSACLQHHWTWYKKQAVRISRETNTTEEAIAAAEATGAYNDLASSTITSINSSTSNLSAKSSSSPKVSSKHNFQIDPPPLDEALVTFLLALMSRFLNQMHVIEERNDQLALLSPEHSNDALATASKVDPQTLEYIREVYTTSGKVLYYVSASNWNSYYAKIKNAVNTLGAVSESSELNPPEVRILAFACLNISKLHTILSGKNKITNIVMIHILTYFFARFKPIFLKYENSGQIVICKNDENGYLEMDGNETISIC